MTLELSCITHIISGESDQKEPQPYCEYCMTQNVLQDNGSSEEKDETEREQFRSDDNRFLGDSQPSLSR